MLQDDNHIPLVEEVVISILTLDYFIIICLLNLRRMGRDTITLAV